MSIAAFLSTVDGFKGIDIHELESIAASARRREIQPGAHLIRKGEPGDNMQVIESGRVRVHITGGDGSEKMVIHLGEGDLVGEMALLTGEPRSADVIAETPVTVVVLQRDTMDTLLAEYPELAGFLTEILGQRLEQDGGITQVGKYQVLGKLGEGTTGKIYEAYHPMLDRVVAMKMLSHSLVYNLGFRERFLQEARTIAGLVHPNIIQVFDTEAAYATYFIIMEKLTGTDLERMLRRQRRMNLARAVPILRQVAAALEYAHRQGFAHRDVKPANVAIDEVGRVKLMDFGIARPIPKEKHGQRAKTVDGTPQYIAPETALGLPADGRVDIYSLGVMAFEMVTGRLPFEGGSVMDMLRAHVKTPPPDVRTLRPEIPEGLAGFIRGALVKDPEARLTDYGRIRHLLALDEPSLEVDAAEELVRIRYTPDAARSVTRAVEGLLDSLRDVEGVEVARGRLERIGKSGMQDE